MEIFGIKFFTIAFALCIFTIERMHAPIHMCHVLHKAFFKKIHTILLEASNFDDKIASKLPLVILISWNLNIARCLEFTKPGKDPRLLA